MILYHINAGFPLLSEKSVVEGRVKETKRREGLLTGFSLSWRSAYGRGPPKGILQERADQKEGAEALGKG